VNVVPAHTREKYWGKNAREFVPERWLGSLSSLLSSLPLPSLFLLTPPHLPTLARFSFSDLPNQTNSFKAEDANKLRTFPFASGPRICIGKKFALLEMKTIMSMVLQKYKWSVDPGFVWRDNPFGVSTSPQQPLKVIMESINNNK
jgi:cytochrome P450